jgi:hypothetical protein
MKRPVLIVGLLICAGFLTSLEARNSKNLSKTTNIDLSTTKKVFVGWVDLPADQWHIWGYGNRSDWQQVIDDLNQDFQNDCQNRYLDGMVVRVAKNRNDNNAADSDLAIAFSDIHIDNKTYGISLSIHFLDPKTGADITVVPPHLYYERRVFRFQAYLRKALQDVGMRIQVEATGSPMQ